MNGSEPKYDEGYDDYACDYYYDDNRHYGYDYDWDGTVS